MDTISGSWRSAPHLPSSSSASAATAGPTITIDSPHRVNNDFNRGRSSSAADVKSRGIIRARILGTMSHVAEGGTASTADPMRAGTLRDLALGVGVALAYFVAAQIGFRLAFVAEQVTTVWAPTGIAIATLLLCGVRLWPAIWLGAFLANATTTAPLWTAMFIATGNTLEAVVAVLVLGRLRRSTFTLERVTDVLAFFVVAALGATALSATIGVVTLCSAGVQSWSQFVTLWFEWWFGDVLGAVLITTAIVATLRSRWSRADFVRAALFVVASVIVTELVFGQVLGLRAHPLEYAIFPVVIAAAATAGLAVTSFVVLSASAVAIWHTIHGTGPFAAQGIHDGLILLQMFMGVLATTAFLLGAAIAERQATESRERSAATMLRLAQHAGGVATFEWDFRRNVARCSAEFFAILGLPERDGIMTGAEWAGFVHPDHREAMAAHLARALDGSEPAAADYRIRRADGVTRWLTYAGQIQRTSDGDRMLGTVVDITDRKLAEIAVQLAKAAAEEGREQLADANRELAEANRVKDEFLATLSHELRTPLNAVLGWTHMLREGNMTPAIHQRAIESLDRNARAQAQLVDDLLDVSRITAGKLQMKSDAVDLAAVIMHAVDTIRAGVAAKRLSLQIALPAAARIIVTGDADRLQQVMWNLVSNAVKFTPSGGRIDVELRQVDAKAEVVVRDNGQGIEPAFQPHLFQRFRQMDASTTRPHGGLGLGLSIVRHLVEAHGGSVAAESDGPDRGATFRVQLPLRDLGSADGAIAIAPAPATHRALAGVRALIVDDEADARDVTRYLLEGRGAAVTVAGSAGEALRALTTAPFDILIADVGMPDQDGLSLIRAVRSFPRGSPNGDIPAVALTAYTSMRERDEAVAAGFTVHVGKPADPEQLIAAIALLNRRESRRY